MLTTEGSLGLPPGRLASKRMLSLRLCHDSVSTGCIHALKRMINDDLQKDFKRVIRAIVQR